jgi:hypothetical protein
MEYKKGAMVMSDKEKDNVIDFVSKSQMRRIAKEKNIEMLVTDEEFKIFLKAFFGEYKGSGYNPE